MNALSFIVHRSLGGHKDGGSLFTALFALSDSKSYRGGEYYIRPRNEAQYYYFKPRQHSAIVFLSETHHGVTDIESGLREMFTNEYWVFDDPPWYSSRRPDFEDMELFTKKTNEILGNTAIYSGEDLEKMWPSRRETINFLKKTGRYAQEEEDSDDSDDEAEEQTDDDFLEKLVDDYDESEL